jgi:transcription elongation factor GreB
MNELLSEKQTLVNEKNMLQGSNEDEKRISLNYINAKLELLNNRILTAKIVNIKEQAPDEVRFGAVITLKEEANKGIRTFQIVGVDEADVSKGKISFISPLARVLINKKIGEKAVLKRGQETLVFEIMEIVHI